MTTTMEAVHLIDEADALARMLVHSEVAKKYKEAKARMYNDQEAQALISRFCTEKEKYEEVRRFGRFHPEYNEVTANIRKLKRRVDLHDSVAAFKKAETELESLLYEISALIAASVSEEIKVPSGNPFFNKHQCSGGCGAGGACQCG